MKSDEGEHELALARQPNWVCRSVGLLDPAAVVDRVATVLGGSTRMYYPGTTDEALAATVSLSGGETPGIDLTTGRNV